VTKATVEANKIYAETHDLNPDLYRFLRQLATLEKALGSNTKLILSTDSPPLHVLEEGPDALRQPSPAQPSPVQQGEATP
jgi:hypothetical protein